jgi:hypothetical protein
MRGPGVPRLTGCTLPQQPHLPRIIIRDILQRMETHVTTKRSIPGARF